MNDKDELDEFMYQTPVRDLHIYNLECAVTALSNIIVGWFNEDGRTFARINFGQLLTPNSGIRLLLIQMKVACISCVGLSMTPRRFPTMSMGTRNGISINNYRFDT